MLSVEEKARSQATLEVWIRSVLRETALWGIQSQLKEVSATSASIRLESVVAVQEICQRAANIWSSRARLRGFNSVADTIQSVAEKGRDDLYLARKQHSTSSKFDTIPTATIEASTERITDPSQRWSLLHNLKRENAHETLDRLNIGNPYHKYLVQQQSERPGRLVVAVPTNAAEEVIIRKRKSYHLKLRTVQEPRPMGRPRKPRISKSKGTLPRPPVDPDDAFENAALNDTEKKEIEELMFHGDDDDADTRLIGAVGRDPKGLPTHLQAPVILEAYGGIYLLPMLKLKYIDDPTKESQDCSG